jgi:hypothetical protein
LRGGALPVFGARAVTLRTFISAWGFGGVFSIRKSTSSSRPSFLFDMSKKSKVRFGVGADKIIREIFAVRENTSGDLTIARRVPRSLREDGQEFSFMDQHFSIHNSALSNPRSTTITQKSRYQGRTRSRAAFIEDTASHLLAHVYSAVPGFVQPETNLLVANGRDSSYVFPWGFTQKTTSVIYSVYVTHKGVSLPQPAETSSTTWDFALYRLHVLFNFNGVPTPAVGVSAFIPTSSAITDGISAENRERVPKPSLSVAEFGPTHVVIVNHVAALAARNFAEEMRSAGYDMPPEKVTRLVELSGHITFLPIQALPK